MAFYDSLGPTPFQLGGDLNLFSSHSSDWALFPLPGASSTGGTNWDGHPDVGDDSGFGGVPVAPWMADITEHQGTLAVAWVEPQWTGTELVMRGPFVKLWDGANWNSLGGEVDPAITPVLLSSSPDPPGSTLGTRSAPARPWILSDGTDLFCVYTVREIAPATNLPPVPSRQRTSSCGCYYNTCDHTDYSYWTQARKVYVRKWDGASWVLWGEMPADSLNGHISDDFGGPEPHGDIKINACASPSEPGVVYVGMYERGFNTSAGPEFYLGEPGLDCIFGLQFGTVNACGFYAGMKLGRFDGGAGTIKTLLSESSSDGTEVGPNPPVWRPQALLVTLPLVRNDGGTPYAFWLSAYGGSFSNSTVSMTDFNTMTTVQTLVAPGVEAVPSSIGWDPVRSKYVLWAPNYFPVVQVNDDGSGPFESLFSPTVTSSDVSPPVSTTLGFLMSKLLPDPGSGGELWFIRHFFGSSAYWGQFHVNCLDWEAWEYASTPFSFDPHFGNRNPALSVGEARPVQIGDSLYAVSMWCNTVDFTQDTRVAVYQVDICRDCANCNLQLMINQRVPVAEQAVVAASGATGVTGNSLLNLSVPIGAQPVAAASGATGVTGANMMVNTHLPL